MKIGVLGLGSIGLRHARSLLGAGLAVKGFDPSPDRGAALADLGGLPVESRAAALDGADGVVVATPPARHIEDLECAVEAGKHVFVEKPIGHRLDGIEDILRAADAGGLAVFAGLNLRFHPVIKAAISLLDTGRLGTPLWARLLAASYLPDWRPGQDYRQGYAADPATGGALFDFIHEFDLAVHLLGPARVVAAAARRTGVLDIPSEDCADVLLGHASGAHSAIHVDYVTRPRRRRIEIAGEGGIMELDLEACRLVLLDREGMETSAQSFPRDTDGMYAEEMRAFLSCMRDGAAPPCDGWQALEVLRLVIEARRLSGLPET